MESIMLQNIQQCHIEMNHNKQGNFAWNTDGDFDFEELSDFFDAFLYDGDNPLLWETNNSEMDMDRKLQDEENELLLDGEDAGNKITLDDVSFWIRVAIANPISSPTPTPSPVAAPMKDTNTYFTCVPKMLL
jgi:hypothetical protein